MGKSASVAIIGAGVVGCALARELSLRYPEKNILVFEKLPGAGLETSGLNSGVLHGGLHQNPDFLKSKLAREGNVLAKEYAKEKGLPLLNCGMIVAVSWSSLFGGLYKEFRSFFGLLRRGLKQGVNLKLLSPRQIRKLEPNLRAAFGIFVPDVSVIDPKSFTEALKRDAEERGAIFYFGEPVQAIAGGANGYILSTPRRRFFAQAVINAAGLYADEIALLAGFGQYKIHPWRGEYYEVVGEKATLVKRLVYPAVPHDSPGKGIHFSPRVDGRLYIGPNARLVPRKNYYAEDKTPKEDFLQTIKRFVPEIEGGDLKWAYSGIRPKLTDRPEETDFVIRLEKRTPPFINLVGIESPGLSSAMAIGKYVAEILKDAP